MRLYSYYGLAAESETLLSKMKQLNISFDSYTLSEAISAAGNSGNTEKAKKLFDTMHSDYGDNISSDIFFFLFSLLVKCFCFKLAKC
jgi:pentatricopeptide repeat protein